MKTKILIVGAKLESCLPEMLAKSAARYRVHEVVVLANASDLTVDTLREMVRAAAQTDPRFLKKPDGVAAAAAPSSIWVSDLIAPQAGEAWRAVIMALDNKSYEVSFTHAGNTVTLGDDAKEVVRTVTYEALQNSADCVDVLGLGNELALDNDGWALLAPFGEHKKEREILRNGRVETERFIQIVDEQSVDAVVANEKGAGMFQRIKRALVKRPIYRDHPDLKLYAPETVAAGNQTMTPLGVNDGCRKGSRGLEFRPFLVPEGAVAAENHGAQYPSALFLLKKTGVVRDGGWIEVRPFALASIGLTPFPNISGAESLANARANKPAASTETKTTDDTNMKALLIGWLAAQGVALANDSTEQATFDAFTGEMNKRVVSLTALGNSKTTLETNLKAERLGRAMVVADLAFSQGKIKADEREAKVTALANSTDFDKDAKALLGEKVIVSLENSATEFRKKHIETSVDLVITQGKVQLAEREAKVTALVALANDKLNAEIEALKALPVKFAVGVTALDPNRKASASLSRSPSDEVIHLANTDTRYKGIADFGDAMQAVLKDHPALAEQLRAKPASTTATVATT